MTESNVTGVDPRYDPRFQRGYTGAGATDASGAPSRQSQSARPIQPTRPPRAPLEELERRASERTARRPTPEEERFSPEARAVPSNASLAGASAHGPVGAGSQDASLDDDRESTSVAWFDESGAASTGSADPWFLGAWVVSVVAVALGAGLFLAAMTGQSFYGPTGPSEQWLQYAGWSIAPSLVQGGLLGIVAMLVWTGVRRARTQAGRASVPGAEDAA
ncbi:MAG TPA: hypothetical protein VKA62_03740 [Agromyces sp.]|nr:hypothetical protein [Agromyces sp.]